MKTSTSVSRLHRVSVRGGVAFNFIQGVSSNRDEAQHQAKHTKLLGIPSAPAMARAGR